MENTKDIYNPAEWTEQDRIFIDTCKQLEPEGLDFLTQMLELFAADPEKEAARADFAEQQAGNYKLKTAEGRAAFMAALQAI